MINIILSGGSGTRLWPLSRKLEPKQFYKLISKHSLFQETILRNKDYCEKQLIVLNEENYFMAVEQLEEIKVDNSMYLIEPIGKNTAPAIALACMALNPDDNVIITPSDHMIKNIAQYHHIIEQAEMMINNNYLVTFGIKPTYAETGYGYIEAELDDVKKFHEKPILEIAEQYLEKGNYYWNSGIFVFKVKTYLEELEKYSPNIYSTCKTAFENAKKSDSIEILFDDMNNIPAESIDFAVMEKSKRVKIIPADIGWSDLGSFDSLYEMLPKDQNNSTILADKNTIEKNSINLDSKNNLIFSSNRTIVSVDVENLIIVDTPDALLITKKGSSQRVKEVVEKLKLEDSELHNIHLKAHRPWGSYTTLENSERYKIKKLIVKPGKRLSLQKHYHKNEHWIVVSGTAKITLEDKEKIVKTNESFYVPMGELHRLENPGMIPLVIIEVQVGDYLGEDDIIRIDDDFKRVK
ncbi:MAG: mannose-1-phosphate guanylyltransferase/mannose-6-phosphate isomerase [Candidatus Sericytochromatia bacterium]|nr:mannose-1-phosphate guanylyltransferase/mannose-6-phosphate isomerase [Candidatus Sericytochromatia bacterium]